MSIVVCFESTSEKLEHPNREARYSLVWNRKMFLFFLLINKPGEKIKKTAMPFVKRVPTLEGFFGFGIFCFGE